MISRPGWPLERNSYILFGTMQFYDNRGKRLYLTTEERRGFIAAAVARGEQGLKGELTRHHALPGQMGWI
jgi:hypothetical protein